MRYASFVTNDKIDISVVMFPGDGGSDADNINRWRQQLGLPPTETSAAIAPLKSADANFSTIDISGANARMLAAWTRRDGRTWFFKLTGPVAAVEKEQPNLRNLFSPFDSKMMLRKFIDLITSLKLTIVCLAAAMVLIFAGTLAQVHLGIHEAQQRYFQSFFVWWPPESHGFKFPIFPGGHLIGAVLLINLIAAHAKRFHWTWRKLGIHLTHAGLIIMLAGGLFTDLFAVESHMRLAQGDTKNYSDDPRLTELAVIDTTDPRVRSSDGNSRSVAATQTDDRAS